MVEPNTDNWLSADEVLELLQEIVLSGLAVSCAFSSPARTHDSLGLVPFALRTIHAAGRRGSSQADLARSLNRSAAWITRLVDHLEGEDWVSRTPHPSDRRVNMLTLTPSGASALEGFIDQGERPSCGLSPIRVPFCWVS